MAIVFDPSKRRQTLADRGVDFANAQQVLVRSKCWCATSAGAQQVLDSRIAEATDDRANYGERRVITAGYLAGRFVVMVWTWRGADRRIISMRRGHADEEASWRDAVG